MNKKMNLYNKSIILILLFPVLLLASCDILNTGLGDKIDMKGPDLAIVSPAYMENVQNDFTLTGTIRDDYEVASLTISVDRLDREWRNVNGTWQTRPDSVSAWSSYSDGTWAAAADGAINWSLDMSLAGTGSGEFIISAVSVDTSGNSDSNSFLQLIVVFDNTPPVLTVISPALENTTASDAASAFDLYNLRSTADMDKMLNGDILFRWSIADDFSVGDLHLELADASGNIYYQADRVNVERNDEIIIPSDQIIIPSDLPGAGSQVTAKTYLQIITTCEDKAGNGADTPVSKGWFCYWPDADTPWIEMSLSDNNASPSTVYPEYTIQGQAYDDDAVESVEITLYSGLTASGTPISSYPVTLTNSRDSRNFTWSFIPPSEAGGYSIAVSCTDENGVSSIVSNGFFEVEDISIPRIFVDTPAQDSALFGDASGDITFSGICDDDSGVASLRLYWVDPHGTNPSNVQLSYMDANNSDWTNGSYPREDAGAGKLFDLSLGSASPGSTGRLERSFSHPLNLFTDLGIDASTPLTNQVFLLRAEDENGKTKVLAYSTSGDSLPPEITIDTVSVNGGLPLDISDDSNRPAIGLGDTVVLRGTWADDSYTVWNSLDPVVKSDYLDSLKNSLMDSFEWNGKTNHSAVDPLSVVITVLDTGFWQTNAFAPPIGSVASISASLADWGGNRSYVSESFFVENETPQLLRISSSTPDGSYQLGETIQIQLDFNKAVTFSGGSSPQLLLNTEGATNAAVDGVYADYVSGNGTMSHFFEYTVSTGDNFSDLDVFSIIPGSITWKDIANTDTIMTLPTLGNSLAGSKDICIDTTAPTISSVSAVSSAGAFKAGDALYLAVEFSENVVLSGSPDPRLELSSGSNIYANYLNTSSPTRLLFQYVITSGENSSDLAVDTFDPNTTTITDIAGNSLVLTIADGSMTGIHIIDTTIPATPGISGIAGGNTYEAEQFTLTGIEAGSMAEYSVDGGTTWQDYSSAVDLNVNGSYTVTARQSDAAGNLSLEAADIGVNVDIGPLLTRISADVSDGIYNSGDSIDITLHFRKTITVTGTPSLTLNTTPPVDVNYHSGSGTSSLVYRYTVGASENVSGLDVSSLNMGTGDFTDSDNTVVNAWCNLADLTAGMSLAEQKSIEILNGLPVVNTVSLAGTTLTLSFNRNIYKGTGSIELAQIATGYKVPSVMTQPRYDEVYNAADAAGKAYLEANYSWTTNGASVTGVPDLDGKYVLNAGLDNNDATMVSHFRNADAHIVSIPVLSSNVSISGSDMTINLTGAYALPVMGASYDLSVPAGLVMDTISNNNPADTGNISSDGIEPPVIRVDKQSETLAQDGGNVVAEQPLTVNVKIDCETPGADIYYEMEQEVFLSNPIEIPGANSTPNPNADPAGMDPYPSMGTSPAVPADPSVGGTSYSGAFAIGNAANHTDGYKYFIRARASVGPDWSDSAYEVAYRSVLLFENDGNVELWGGDAVADIPFHDYGPGVEQVWIRGGDSITGGTLTPGFPLAWDDAETDKVRLMTCEGAIATADWYWISWEVNATAYVGLLLGSTPTTVADAELGPLMWGWGKNAWTGSKAYYPLFPGESRTLQSSVYNTINGVPRGNFTFADPGADTIYPLP